MAFSFILNPADRGALLSLVALEGEWTVPTEEDCCVYTPHKPEFLDPAKTAEEHSDGRWRVCDPTLLEYRVDDDKEAWCERLAALDDGDGRSSTQGTLLTVDFPS
jgi:hypothetical protein